MKKIINMYFLKVLITGIPDRMFIGHETKMDRLPDVNSKVTMSSAIDDDREVIVLNVKSVEEVGENENGYTHSVELEYVGKE